MAPHARLLAAVAALAATVLLPPCAAYGGRATVDCYDSDVREAVEAVQNHTLARRNVHFPGVYHTLTRGQLAALHPCVTARHAPVRARHFAITVMCATKNRKRLVNQLNSWGKRATDSGAKVYYVSDKRDEEFPAVVALKDPATRDPSYDGAQHRSLRGLQNLVSKEPLAKWFWMVDDDTYYDVAEAAAAVRFINPEIPLLVGYVFRGRLRFGSNVRSSISGGAGMLLSRGAAVRMSKALYTPECPFDKLNDLTMTSCAVSLNIPMMHHEGFQPDFDDFSSNHVHWGGDTSELGGAITAHRLIPDYYVLGHVTRLAAMKPLVNLTTPLHLE